MGDKIVCLLCGGTMRLDVFRTTSWWQCEADETHRMTLPEYFDLMCNEKTNEEIRQAMDSRRLILEAQKQQQNGGNA